MENKENTFDYPLGSGSLQGNKPKDFAGPNPLLSVSFENKWEPSWDQSLQTLVIECAFEFEQISSRMNATYQTTAFTTEACQKRWGEIHKQRKQKKPTEEESNKEKVDRLMRLSAPPMQDPKKGMTLKELEETLPKTRTSKDFLDPSYKEFDREVDTLITGEKIKPSGFNILKDRIRPSEAEQKKLEEEFLKSLEKISAEFSDIDNESPFVFKPIFQGANDVKLERLPFDHEEAKKRLEEQVDMTQFKSYEKEPLAPIFAKPVEEENLPNTLIQKAQIAAEIDLQKHKEDEGAEQNDDFVKLFNKPIDVSEAVKALEKLEENIVQKRKKFINDVEEVNLEDDTKAQDMFTTLESMPQQAYQKFQNWLAEPQNPVGESEKKEPAPAQKEPLQKKENAAPVKEAKVEGAKPAEPQKKDKAKEEGDKLEEIRRARLFENLKAREVQDFEGSDVSEEEFLEGQRKKVMHREGEQTQKQTKTVTIDERRIEKEEDVTKDGEKEEKEEKEISEEEKREIEKVMKENKEREEREAREKAEEEEKISEERLRQLIEASFAFKKNQNKEQNKVAEEENLEEKEEEKEEDEEERRKREKREKKLEEHGKKLASLLKEVNKRNEDFEKQREEEERKLKEEEEKKMARQNEEKEKEAIDNLKSSWTNSYVTSLFDDKVSYMKKTSALPEDLRNHFEGKQIITERERLLGRYQMICLPMLSTSNEYISCLLEYFLRFSNFNVTKHEGYKVDHETTFPFKAIAVGMFTRFEGKGKTTLQQTVEEGGLVDYFYVVFDTFEGRGMRILEDVVRGIQLDFIFGEEGAKKIQKEVGQEGHTLVLKDIIIFHYKSMEMIDEAFNTPAALKGICLSKTEDPKENEYETTVVLFPFQQKPKVSNRAKESESWKSNVKSFLNKVTKENLSIVGVKSMYLTREELSDFKYKIGTLSLSEPQPLIAVAIGGYRAVEKVKNIVGSSDTTIARKLEPKSINAKYSIFKAEGPHIVCCPTNSHTAKKWLSYMFGGRVSPKDMMFPDQASKFKKDPKNFQIITKPIKKVTLIISSKMGNKGLPHLLKELVQKGFFVSNMQMFTRNFMKQHLESVDSLTAQKFVDLANKLELHCFKFSCDTTENRCNFLVSLKGTNPMYLRGFLHKLLFPKEKTAPRYLVSMIEEDEDIELIDKVFFHNRVKYSSPEFSRGKDMKHYLFVRPMESVQDLQHGCEELEALMSQDVELIGCEILQPHRLHIVRNFMEDSLMQSIKVSSHTKKRKEFSNFVKKTADYLEHGLSLLAVLRLQDPIKTTEDLVKLPALGNSNYYIPETIIFSFGRTESSTPVTRDILEKFLLEFSMDEMIKTAEKLCIGLGDDRTIEGSFIYDLPPKIDGIVQNELVSTVLLIAKSTVALSSLSFLVKFFEQREFTIQNLSLLHMPEELINGVQYNYSFYNPQDVEKWPNLKEKMATEPFWTFVLSKYNAIFECKNIIYDLLRKVHMFSKDAYKKQISDKDLPYLYGVYFSRSFEDSQRDLETLKDIYQKNKHLLTANKADLVSKLEHLDASSSTTEPAFMLFRTKQGGENQELYEFLGMLQNFKIRILNLKAVEIIHEDDKEALVEVFKAKHNEDALRMFISGNKGNYYLMSIEYKLGTTLNEIVGSFRMKSPEEVVEFSKGHLIKRYGCEFLYTSNFQEVEKLTVRFFGAIDSENFRLV